MKDRYEKIAYYIADERREMKDYFINNNKMLDFIAISDSVIVQVKNKNNSTENKAFIYEKEYYKSSFKVTNSETQTIKLARQNSGFFHVKKDILYINPTYLKDSFDAELLKSSSKLVIDLREYPKMNLDISNLVPPNVPFSLLQRSTQVPGYLESFFMHTPVDAVYDKGKKIIVLISESSISNAEFMSLQLKTNKNTILVGRNTAGANGNVLQIPVVGGGSGVNFRYSSIRVLFPSKKETQIIGIEPDIFVENSMDELIEKKDLIFEKAIELLK
ncbi:S41 family peptidase [Sphingobacterium faecium]